MVTGFNAAAQRAIRLGAAVLALAAAGCQASLQNGDGAMAASAVRDPVLHDIPRPNGFALDERTSLAFASGRVRVARCAYHGPTDAMAVKRFYEEYMPAARFRLLQWSLDQGVYTMRFESEHELCSVRIHRDRGRTGLLIEIGPRPQGSAEREEAPPMPRRRRE